jgi:hypothetical protein
MSARVKILVGLAVVAAGAVAAVLATRGDASRDGASLSNRGRPISVTSRELKLLKLEHGRLLAVRNDRALYRFTDANGDDCFGAGRANDVGSLGSLVCQRIDFPTTRRPILDLSVYEGDRRGVRELSLYRAEGFAADGIAAVEFFRPDGDVALRVPVAGNVYSTTTVPKGPVWGLAALDRDGKRVWRSP